MEVDLFWFQIAGSAWPPNTPDCVRLFFCHGNEHLGRAITWYLRYHRWTRPKCPSARDFWHLPTKKRTISDGSILSERSGRPGRWTTVVTGHCCSYVYPSSSKRVSTAFELQGLMGLLWVHETCYDNLQVLRPWMILPTKLIWGCENQEIRATRIANHSCLLFQRWRFRVRGAGGTDMTYSLQYIFCIILHFFFCVLVQYRLLNVFEDCIAPLCLIDVFVPWTFHCFMVKRWSGPAFSRQFWRDFLRLTVVQTWCMMLRLYSLALCCARNMPVPLRQPGAKHWRLPGRSRWFAWLNLGASDHSSNSADVDLETKRANAWPRMAQDMSQLSAAESGWIWMEFRR